MSASEMLCLIRYLGIIIGDLIPEDNSCWMLYKHFRRIIDIVTSPRLICTDIKILKNSVAELNQLFIHLYGTLKPKFHILLHYVRILLLNGPCIHYWSMRFESRHLQKKQMHTQLIVLKTYL